MAAGLLDRLGHEAGEVTERDARKLKDAVHRRCDRIERKGRQSNPPTKGGDLGATHYEAAGLGTGNLKDEISPRQPGGLNRVHLGARGAYGDARRSELEVGSKFQPTRAPVLRFAPSGACGKGGRQRAGGLGPAPPAGTLQGELPSQ